MGVRHYVNFPTMETAEYSWVDISVELDMSDSWVPSDLRSSRIEETYSANYYYDLTADATRSSPTPRRTASSCPERQRKKSAA